MIIRLLLALIFTALVVLGSSAIVYRGWQINHPGTPGPDVLALVKSPGGVKSLTAEEVGDSLVAVVTGQPQKQPIVTAKSSVSLPFWPAAEKPVATGIERTEVRTSTAWTPTERGCALGGLAGGGATLVFGPAEVAAFAAGAAVPATIRVVGTVIGAALVAGCAAGAVVVPMLDK